MLIRDERTGKSLVMFHTRKTGDVNIKQWFKESEDFSVDYRLFDDGYLQLNRDKIKEYKISKIFCVKRNPYSRAISQWRWWNWEMVNDTTFDEWLDQVQESRRHLPEKAQCPLDYKGERCESQGCDWKCQFHKNCVETQESLIGNLFPVQLLSFENLQEDFTEFMRSIDYEGDTTFPKEIITQPLDWLKKELARDVPKLMKVIYVTSSMINTDKYPEIVEEIKALQPNHYYDKIMTSEHKDRVYDLFKTDFHSLGYSR